MKILILDPSLYSLPATLASFPRFKLTLPPQHPINPFTSSLTSFLHLKQPSSSSPANDVNCGLAFGGSKARKLECLILHALAHLCLKCVLIQSLRAKSADLNYERLGNLQLSRLIGAEGRVVGKEAAESVH